MADTHHGSEMASCNLSRPWACSGPLTCPIPVEPTRTAGPPSALKVTGSNPVLTTESLAQCGWCGTLIVVAMTVAARGGGATTKEVL